MLQELMAAHQTDLILASRTIEHRMEWEQLVRVGRLERALKTARAKLHVVPNLSIEAN